MKFALASHFADPIGDGGSWQGIGDGPVSGPPPLDAPGASGRAAGQFRKTWRNRPRGLVVNVQPAFLGEKGRGAFDAPGRALRPLRPLDGDVFGPTGQIRAFEIVGLSARCHLKPLARSPCLSAPVAKDNMSRAQSSCSSTSAIMT